jgi:hypothetical protein
MKTAACLVVSLFLISLAGCDQPAPTPKEHHVPPIHRFENVSTTGATGVALDTVTGQWCKTWEWVYKADSMSGGLDTLPTCLSLYNLTDAQAEYDSIKKGAGK